IFFTEGFLNIKHDLHSAHIQGIILTLGKQAVRDLSLFHPPLLSRCKKKRLERIVVTSFIYLRNKKFQLANQNLNLSNLPMFALYRIHRYVVFFYFFFHLREEICSFFTFHPVHLHTGALFWSL
ncbi:hypothetical protein Tcan_00930, partial [Toxocara canis]